LNLQPLAKKIHDEVYRRFYDYKTTIFLCGAGSQDANSIRDKLNKELTNSWYSFHYDMFYPEDLFDELLFGPKHQDLISLENILADSVDAIVLIVESYGAVAELGAFASNKRLRKKLICIVDEKYKKKKSFINYGPLRLLKDKHEGHIVYADYENINKSVEYIRRKISEVKKGMSKKADVTNVVQAHHFILPSIYLLEPVSRDTLVQLVKFASDVDDRKATALATGAISILNKKKEIALSPAGYRLSPSGLDRFSKLGRRGWTQHTYDTNAMDVMRVAILNWQCRGKRLKIGT